MFWGLPISVQAAPMLAAQASARIESLPYLLMMPWRRDDG